MVGAVRLRTHALLTMLTTLLAADVLWEYFAYGAPIGPQVAFAAVIWAWISLDSEAQRSRDKITEEPRP